MNDTNKATVYFDGSCPLCRAEVELYASGPGGACLTLKDVSNPATPLPDGLTQEAALARFHVSRANGETLSGAAAFFALWEVLPRWRLLARFGRLPGVKTLAECVYRLFLVVRPLLVGVFVRLRGQR